MRVTMILVVLCLLQYSVGPTFGMAYLSDPPSRGVVGMDPMYDMLMCGGLKTLRNNKGRCGVCGDDYSLEQPRPHELGGKYGKGHISAIYKPGSIITVKVNVSMAKLIGHFSFDVCRRSTVAEPSTEPCFAKWSLRMEDGRSTFVAKEKSPSVYYVKLSLPEELECSNCVLRWKFDAHYIAQKRPNKEKYINCADVAIEDINKRETVNLAKREPFPSTTMDPFPKTTTPPTGERTTAFPETTTELKTTKKPMKKTTSSPPLPETTAFPEITTEGKTTKKPMTSMKPETRQCYVGKEFKMVPGMSEWCNSDNCDGNRCAPGKVNECCCGSMEECRDKI